MEANRVDKEYGIGDIAVLKFELTGMQAAIKKAVMMRAEGLQELIDREVQAQFTPEKIQEAIKRAVEIEFDSSMKYGAGAAAVRSIVERQVTATIKRLSKED